MTIQEEYDEEDLPLDILTDQQEGEESCNQFRH
jgi:hypothetical protein